MADQEQEWREATEAYRAWADQAAWLAESAGSGIAKLTVEDTLRAATLAEAACRLPAEEAARLRLAAATIAESAAEQAKVVISDLRKAASRAEAAGKGNAAGLLQAEVATWERAFDVAHNLRSLSGPGDVPFPEIGKLLRRVGAGHLLPGGSKKWWQFWK